MLREHFSRARDLSVLRDPFAARPVCRDVIGSVPRRADGGFRSVRDVLLVAPVRHVPVACFREVQSATLRGDRARGTRASARGGCPYGSCRLGRCARCSGSTIPKVSTGYRTGIAYAQPVTESIRSDSTGHGVAHTQPVPGMAQDARREVA
eukprot:280931-Rhodomonas_salina.1